METVGPERPGVVRLLEEEPTAAERYAHAARLLAIVQREAATTQRDGDGAHAGSRISRRARS